MQSYDCPKFRIGTFNIKVGVDSSLSQVASDLYSLGLDLCALQEVGQHWSLGQSIDQTHYLAKAQNHDHAVFHPLLERSWTLDPYKKGPFHFQSYQQPYHPFNSDNHLGYYGISLTANGKLNHIERHYLPYLDDELRGILVASWQPNHSFKPLTIINTHLSTNANERYLQTKVLINLLNQIDGPVIMLGDFNDTPQSEIINLLNKQNGFNRLAPSNQINSYTFSVNTPQQRIDYLFGRGVNVFNYGIAEHVKSSDHFPVWADLTW